MSIACTTSSDFLFTIETHSRRHWNPRSKYWFLNSQWFSFNFSAATQNKVIHRRMKYESVSRVRAIASVPKNHSIVGKIQKSILKCDVGITLCSLQLHMLRVILFRIFFFSICCFPYLLDCIINLCMNNFLFLSLLFQSHLCIVHSQREKRVKFLCGLCLFPVLFILASLLWNSILDLDCATHNSGAKKLWIHYRFKCEKHFLAHKINKNKVFKVV